MKRWDSKLSKRANAEIVRDICTILLNNGSKQLDDLRYLVSNDRYKDLIEYSLDYNDISVSDAIIARQVLAFFQKRQDIDVGVDREQVAFTKWLAAESACADTNRRFRAHASGRLSFPPRLEAILHIAARKIASILGDCPDVSEIKARFGPGATTNVKRTEAHPVTKIREGFTCSEELVRHCNTWLAEFPHWVEHHATRDDPDVALVPLTVTVSRLGFVPKNALSDRSVDVQPSLNMFFQLGYGDYMSNRLRRFGIDISDQTRNQRSARVGSLTGALATLDLSNASDTIARELVYHLLPVDWFLVLDSMRTKCTHYPKNDTTYRLEKFSAMGNGFTFPLETLIFYSLVWAVHEHLGLPSKRVLAYGDDLVVEVGAYAACCEILQFCGFSVNLAKSYAAGPFRESCGKDYLSGIDIRPVYVKDRLTCADLFRIHNFFYRNFETEVCRYILALIPDHLKLFGPDGYGDGHLLGEWKPRTPKKRRTHGYGGYTFDTFSFKARKKFVPAPGDYVYPLYSIYIQTPFIDPPWKGNGLWRRMNDVYGRLVQYWSDRSATRYGKRGDLEITLPGKQGYKRVSIYTLSN